MLKHKAAPRTNQESDETWVEIQPPPTEYDDAWQSGALEPFKKMYGVKSAAALHPSLAFIDAKLVWPSSSVTSFVSDEILASLRQARASLISNGFAVNSDPVNPLGDRKSWALRCEITDKIADGTDPIEIAGLCQQNYASPAPRPFWDGGLITVPLWRSGLTSVRRGRTDEQASRSPLSSCAKRPPEAILDLLLKRQGLSRPDLARKAKVDYNTINAYMKGKTRPYASTLKKIADALGLKAEELP